MTGYALFGVVFAPAFLFLALCFAGDQRAIRKGRKVWKPIQRTAPELEAWHARYDAALLDLPAARTIFGPSTIDYAYAVAVADHPGRSPSFEKIRYSTPVGLTTAVATTVTCYVPPTSGIYIHYGIGREPDPELRNAVQA